MKAKIFWAATTLISALIAAVAFAPTRVIVTEIVIDAPPDRVWDVLTDGANYEEWNPWIVGMDGDIEPGATLTTVMVAPSGQQRTFQPTVLIADENREFRWLGRIVMPRIFDAEHYFLLADEAGRTRVTHGEIFSGIGLWYIDVEEFRSNLEDMNDALKTRVEAESGT